MAGDAQQAGAGNEIDRDAGRLRQRGQRRRHAEVALDHDGGGRRLKRGKRHGRVDRLSAILVKTAAGLLAQPARVDQFFLLQGRGVARVAVQRVVDRAGDGVIDVVADQVHQLEGAHAKAAAAAQDGVDRRHIGRAFGQQAQRLAVERTGHAVDDKARRRGAAHRHLAPRQRGGEQGVGHGLRGDLATDDFHQRQHGSGVEEVQAGHLLRALQAGRNRGHRQRRGIAGDNGVRRQQRLDLGQYLGLDVDVFHDRFDHQRRLGQVGQVGAALQPRQAVEAGGFVDLALGLQALVGVGDRGDAAIERGRRRVVQHHVVAGVQRHLDDAAAHGAGADHADQISCL